MEASHPRGAVGDPEDASKAHRRIKALQPDWRYHVAVNKGKLWANEVGTYGMASVQLYWGRMAALLIRLLYAFFLNVDWQFVYVDDFIWLLRADSAALMGVAILATLAAVGLPIAWRKTVLLVAWLYPQHSGTAGIHPIKEAVRVVHSLDEGPTRLPNEIIRDCEPGREGTVVPFCGSLL